MRRNTISLSTHYLSYSLLNSEVEAARSRREEIESTINKNFKSRPVPAETYYPLYHDILLQSDSRRRLVLESRRAELELMQRPPSFIDREERKKREKAEKIRKIKDDEERLIGLLSKIQFNSELLICYVNRACQPTNRVSTAALLILLGNSFRARDVDENILEQSVNYDEVEDERQTRMKTRSQQLLRFINK